VVEDLFAPIVHTKNEFRKRSDTIADCEMRSAERPNLISVIAQHRAPRPVKLMLASRLPIVSAVFHWASRRFGRSAACPKPQRVCTHGPLGNSPRQPPAFRCELGQLALRPIVHPKLNTAKEPFKCGTAERMAHEFRRCPSF
jgi:hypothetical protein